jgi:NADH dehydrogenase/NADH:ubiquinone oxidoreductase subunit G
MPRRPFTRPNTSEDLVYESGKCISCRLCVAITQQEKEALGLTFIGRGFDVRIGVPFNHSLAEALRKTAAHCVAVCPTGALAFGRDKVETDRGEKASPIAKNTCPGQASVAQR